MDKVNRKIVEILKENGRATYINIGKKVGLSEGAVRKRIKTLVSSGVIKRFTVEIEFTENAETITLLNIDPSFPTSEICEKLKKLPNIETVYEVTGQYDIAVIISALSIAEVNDCVEKIRRLDGIAHTNTMIILRSF